MKDIILVFFAFLIFHFGIVLAACVNLLIHYYYSGNWLLYWGVLYEGVGSHLIWFVIIIFLARLKNGKKDNK